MSNYRIVNVGSDSDTYARIYGDGFGNGSFCQGNSAVDRLKNVVFPSGFRELFKTKSLLLGNHLVDKETFWELKF